MSTKEIPQSRLEGDLRTNLLECLDTGEILVVEMPDHRLVAIVPLDSAAEDDSFISDLIESNPAFRALLARSKASPRIPFSAADED
ncbi:MAG TPA: hypothetical protein VG406_19105 [Isosphaeraceae bacterium]|jgi:hypothetical protein|nr:hypothetical protein [Isosphaeraceae bacterium]